jgi:hypothetical protein
MHISISWSWYIWCTSIDDLTRLFCRIASLLSPELPRSLALAQKRKLILTQVYHPIQGYNNSESFFLVWLVFANTSHPGKFAEASSYAKPLQTDQDITADLTSIVVDASRAWLYIWVCVSYISAALVLLATGAVERFLKSSATSSSSE